MENSRMGVKSTSELEDSYLKRADAWSLATHDANAMKTSPATSFFHIYFQSPDPDTPLALKSFF